MLKNSSHRINMHCRACCVGGQHTFSSNTLSDWRYNLFYAAPRAFKGAELAPKVPLGVRRFIGARNGFEHWLDKPELLPVGWETLKVVSTPTTGS